MVIGFDGNFPLKEKVVMQELHNNTLFSRNGFNYPVIDGKIDHSANNNPGPKRRFSRLGISDPINPYDVNNNNNNLADLLRFRELFAFRAFCEKNH